MRGQKKFLSRKKLVNTTTIALAVFIAATLIFSSAPANMIAPESNKLIEDKEIKQIDTNELQEVKDLKEITSSSKKAYRKGWKI